ncbi:hypothetical protein NIIDMKKI_41070 [Mycobacterium kansasii]|uniref:Uncharacterized protein n=1 Tax=Mycobacterium kansasii TaxID=1768 RepID=A0A7G1ICY1_MYCKA|nr:hypothetical protein NIIDMKKI_41070 [Mycobacterium kansasii]
MWAYDLAWRPTLVFQTYQALTPMLDALNGESLTNGPEFVLSRLSPALPAVGIDGRLGVQESPLYSRALLCNYTLSGIENRWALFKHTAPTADRSPSCRKHPCGKTTRFQFPPPAHRIRRCSLESTWIRPSATGTSTERSLH